MPRPHLPIQFAVALLLTTACATTPPGTGTLHLSDAARFAESYPAVQNDPHCAALAPYHAEASDGLRAFHKITGTPAELCAAVHARPAAYAAVASHLAALEDQAPRIASIYDRYAEALPGAALPDLYVVVGRGWWGGTVRGGRIYVGLEVVEAEAVPCLMAHELAHAQQRTRRIGMLTGGPAFLRGTLLAHSLKEGIADLIAEEVAGCAPPAERTAWALEHEAELWAEFREAMHGKEYQPWIYGAAAEGRPADLGYFFGYRIARAWYERSPDREAALREMLRMRDPERFLRESGYDPR
jgi:hypothetical protein